jgi:uncharacterized protein
MADYYFDTSALAKRYVLEPGSEWVRQRLAPTTGHVAYIVRVTGAEVVAALALRRRMGTILPTEASAAIALFRTDFGRRYAVIEVSAALVSRAMTLAERHSLRGYDSVQLAAALMAQTSLIAAGYRLDSFVSADSRLNAAALAEGLTVIDPTTQR